MIQPMYLWKSTLSSTQRLYWSSPNYATVQEQILCYRVYGGKSKLLLFHCFLFEKVSLIFISNALDIFIYLFEWNATLWAKTMLTITPSQLSILSARPKNCVHFYVGFFNKFLFSAQCYRSTCTSVFHQVNV